MTTAGIVHCSIEDWSFAVLVACNQASEKACNDAVLALIADHFKERP